MLTEEKLDEINAMLEHTDITQEVNTGYHNQGSLPHKHWKWLRDRFYIDFIPKFYVIIYCVLSYVI
jgi:hypothetical protein